MCAMCPCPCWNGDMLLPGSGPLFSRSPGFVSSHYSEVPSRWDTQPSEKPGGGGAGRAAEPFNPCRAKAEITEIEALQQHHSTWKSYTDIKKEHFIHRARGASAKTAPAAGFVDSKQQKYTRRHTKARCLGRRILPW